MLIIHMAVYILTFKSKIQKNSSSFGSQNSHICVFLLFLQPANKRMIGIVAHSTE